MAARTLLALVAVAILLLVGISAVDAGVQTAGDERSIDNESWTPDAGNVSQLNRSGLTDVYYDDSVTVRDENGTVMDAGIDYEWIESNGTVKALTGERLDGDASAEIDYGYHVTNDELEAQATLFANMFDAAAIVVMLLAVAVLVVGLRVFGGG